MRTTALLCVATALLLCAAVSTANVSAQTALPHLPPAPDALPPLPTAVVSAITEYLTANTLAPCNASVPSGASAPGVAGAIVFGNDVHYVSLGCRDKASGAPVTPDTHFRIASVSKTFTVDGLLREVEKGRLRSLDEEVASSGVPGAKDFYVRNPFGTDQPTWRQLASQLAGLQRETPCDAGCNTTTAAVLGWLRNYSALILPPNWQPSYSNLAFDIIGNLLAEGLHNSSYEAWLQDTVLQPLAMADTGTTYPPDVMATLATPYAGDGSVAPFTPLGWGAPDGGVRTTARDAAKFIQHWLRGARTSSFRRENFQPRFLNQDGNSGFGTPWEMYRAGPGEHLLRTKSGDLPGYTAQLILSPELAFGMAFFWNGVAESYTVQDALAQLALPTVQGLVDTAFRRSTFPPVPPGVAAAVNRTYVSDSAPIQFQIDIATGTGTRGGPQYAIWVPGFGTFWLRYAPSLAPPPGAGGPAPAGSAWFTAWMDPALAGPPSYMLTEFISVNGAAVVLSPDLASAWLPGVFPRATFKAGPGGKVPPHRRA